MVATNEELRNLLIEARSYLFDKRLWWDENGNRRQREIKQEHADRISDYIEQNECLRNLIEHIDEVLKGKSDDLL